jgi:acyl-CoA thioesterase FadM
MKSVTFTYEVRRTDGLLCLTGRIVAAAVDASGRSIPLPDPLRDALAGAL